MKEHDCRCKECNKIGEEWELIDKQDIIYSEIDKLDLEYHIKKAELLKIANKYNDELKEIRADEKRLG